MTILHPTNSASPLRLYGRRLMLRPLTPSDYVSWSELRIRNGDWLTKWEPTRLPTHADPVRDRDAFTARCAQRDRERQAGTGYSFGMFVGPSLVGEVNLNNVARGSLQGGSIGYWIDQKFAGQGLTAEAVVVLLRYAFAELRLHRIEICIIPRNKNSHRVVEKIGLRSEGIAISFLEINGVWEDHVRYAITVDEWQARRQEFIERFL